METASQYSAYDGLGKRRLKVVDDVWTWFRWDAGWNMIAEYGAGTNPSTIYDIGDRSMTCIPGLAQIPGTNPSTGDYAYFATDHLGSVRGVYDASKVMTAAMDYTPYGTPRAWRGDVPSPTYTGHHWDGETSMYFAPYRYYMPNAGRWLTRDPLGMVDGPNVYGYVMGNPLAAKDVLGLSQVPGDDGTFDDDDDLACVVIFVCSLALCSCAKIRAYEDCEANVDLEITWNEVVFWPDRPTEDWWDVLYDTVFVDCDKWEKWEDDLEEPPRA